MSSVCVSSITPDPSSLPSSSTFVTLNLVGWLSGMLSLHRQLQQLPMTAAGEVIPLGNWLFGFSEGEKIPLPLSLYVLRDFMVTRCQHCPEHEGNSPIFHLARKPLRSTGFSSRLTQEDVTLYLASTASSLCIQGLIATQPTFPAAPRHPALAPALQHLPAASTSRKVL